MVTITPKDVRAARAYIHKRGLTASDISPRDLATFAERYGKTLSSALRLVAAIKMGGQGGSQFEKTKEALIDIEEAKA